MTTMLLAIGGLVLGLALGTVGTLLLGSARAAAKRAGSADQGVRADLRQYAAALCALVGFVVTGVAGGLLTRELVPFDDPLGLAVAAVVGVLVFAAAVIVFSRIADLAEEAAIRKLPRPAYPSTPRSAGEPVSAPPRPIVAPPRSSATGSGAAGRSIADGEALLRAVRPGWIYRDTADHWYLGVVDEHGRAFPLLRLPEFALAPASEPTYPLTVAGAGEIAVVPLPATPDEAGFAGR